MAERGRLTEWNDERGFGYITPLSGGSRVFVHISEFPRELRRPMVSDLVSYSLGHDDRNRARAQAVAFLTPTHARHEYELHPLSGLELGIPAAFAVVLVGLTVFAAIPATVLGLYTATSFVAFLMYWRDKVAAQRGEWRTSEAALLAIALAGGWPGAVLARHALRHKTRKQPFRTYFWLVVVANCLVLAFIAFERGPAVPA